MWPHKAVGYVKDLLGSTALEASALCQGQGATSCFSGVGTAELACVAIKAAVTRIGLSMRLVTEFTVEIDSQCRAILHRHVRAHSFGDIMELLDLALLEPHVGLLQEVPRYKGCCCEECGLVSLLRAALPSEGRGYGLQWSSLPRLEPCWWPGWCASGSRIHCLLAWCRLHREWDTPIIIHENVLNVLSTFCCS